MSLRPLLTHLSQVSSLYAPYTTTGGGGGGGGPAITTSSITVSTINAAGTILDYISGDPTKLDRTWIVEMDSGNNSADALTAPSTLLAYRDIRVADATGLPLQQLREVIGLGSAQIQYSSNPAGAATTGLKFISSLNGGSDATALLGGAGAVYPLGFQNILPNSATVPAGAFGVPVAAAFSTIAGHTYEVQFGVSEQVASGTGLGGACNPQDRISYTCGSAIFDTQPHSLISTLQGASPRGRIITGIFEAVGVNQQVVASANTGSLLSTIITPSVDPASMKVRDLGPLIFLP